MKSELQPWMRVVRAVVLLVALATSRESLAAGFENLTITIRPPVCFGNVCAILVGLPGYESLPPALLAEDGTLRTCGSAGAASIATASFEPRGKSRLIVKVRSNRGLVEKNCNPVFLPQKGIKSGFAYRTYYFDKSKMPRFLKVVLRDRKTGASRALKADVPPVAPISDYPCEMFVESFGSYSRVRNLYLETGELYTVCFQQPVSTPYFPFFEISLINRGNSSCSHVWMRSIRPDGQSIVYDYGPAPVVRPNNVPGAWKVQVLLEDGCNRYDLWVDH